jgi:hypothetical protein
MLDARARPSPKITPETVLERYRRKYRILFQEEREQYGDIIGDIRRIYEGYERRYAKDPWTYLRTEHLLTIDLAKNVRFIGYEDKFVSDQEGRLWIVDHKSYKTIPNEDDRFSDLQSVFYIWAHQLQHPKEAVTGFCWDYLRTKAPAIPQVLVKGGLTKRANIDTDYYTYLDAIKSNNLNPRDYIDLLNRLKKENSRFFKRVYLPSPSKEMIKTAVTDAKNTAIEIKNLGTTLRDRNMTRDCPRFCDYYNICQTEYRGIDSEYVRKTEYEEREPSEDDPNETE